MFDIFGKIWYSTNYIKTIIKNRTKDVLQHNNVILEYNYLELFKTSKIQK